MKRLIQDADGVYMIDEECLKKKEEIERQKEMKWQQRKPINVSSKSKQEGIT